MASSPQDPFHRQLYNVLADEILNRKDRLATGSASTITGDGQTVAEKYAAQVSYIRALTDVLSRCADIEDDMMGVRPADESAPGTA